MVVRILTAIFILMKVMPSQTIQVNGMILMTMVMEIIWQVHVEISAQRFTVNQAEITHMVALMRTSTVGPIRKITFQPSPVNGMIRMVTAMGMNSMDLKEMIALAFMGLRIWIGLVV
jgi:hypothetical protein